MLPVKKQQHASKERYRKGGSKKSQIANAFNVPRAPFLRADSKQLGCFDVELDADKNLRSCPEGRTAGQCSCPATATRAPHEYLGEQRDFYFRCGRASAKPTDVQTIPFPLAKLNDIVTHVGHVGASKHKEPRDHRNFMKPNYEGSAEALEGSRSLLQP